MRLLFIFSVLILTVASKPVCLRFFNDFLILISIIVFEARSIRSLDGNGKNEKLSNKEKNEIRSTGVEQHDKSHGQIVIYKLTDSDKNNSQSNSFFGVVGLVTVLVLLCFCCTVAFGCCLFFCFC